MTIHWMLLRTSSVPEGDDWIGPREREVLSGLEYPKRRLEWRLGRYVAKLALTTLVGEDGLDRFQIIAADDGAPEAFRDGRPIDLPISITHREDVAVCAIATTGVGCDLEVVEPRTSRFVDDFFTTRERGAVLRTPPELVERRVALTWSAKESALKVLRVGLRRDTRSVEIDLADFNDAHAEWNPFTATVRPENRVLSGWWRADEDLVLTVVSEGAEDHCPAALEAVASA